MNKTLILVVEDDTPVHNLITTTLKTHDYKYISAKNGAGAIMEASTHNPDIVLLDLGLPAAECEQFERAADQRLLGECAPEREVEAARDFGGVGADQRRMQRVVEHELEAIAHAGQVGGDDAKPAAGVGGQALARPGGDGGALGGAVGARQYLLAAAVDGVFGLIFDGDAAPGEGGEQRLFERREAVETGEGDGCGQGEAAAGDQVDQALVQAGSVAPAGGPAAFLEFGLPGGEQADLVGDLGASRRDVPDP